MWRNIYRKMKYEYYKLIRMKGAASIIARGFAVGIFIEFITLPTFGLAFLLLYPMNLLFRSSFSASLIGFVLGKIMLPLFMYPNMKLGTSIIGKHVQEHVQHNFSSFAGWLSWMKTNGIAYITGSAVMGVFVAIACYFVVYGVLHWYRKKKARRTVVQNP